MSKDYYENIIDDFIVNNSLEEEKLFDTIKAGTLAGGLALGSLFGIKGVENRIIGNSPEQQVIGAADWDPTNPTIDRRNPHGRLAKIQDLYVKQDAHDLATAQHKHEQDGTVSHAEIRAKHSALTQARGILNRLKSRSEGSK